MQTDKSATWYTGSSHGSTTDGQTGSSHGSTTGGYTGSSTKGHGDMTGHGSTTGGYTGSSTTSTKGHVDMGGHGSTTLGYTGSTEGCRVTKTVGNITYNLHHPLADGKTLPKECINP